MPVDLSSVAAGAKTAKEVFPSLRWAYKWLTKRRYPKAQRRSVGFVVAIAAPNPKEQEQVTEDFLAAIEDLVLRSKLNPPLNLVVLPSHLAAQIKTDKDAERVLRKTRSMYVVWGKARERKFKGEPYHVVDILGSMAAHDYIPTEVSHRLAREMIELTPVRRLIPISDDLAGFEFNAISVGLVAKYIIGEAAFVSNAFEYARDLFKELRQEVQRIPSNVPKEIKQSLHSLKARVSPNLAACHIKLAGACHYKWRDNRSPELLELMKAHLDEAERIEPNFYDAWLLRAIYHFVKDRDIKAAMKLITLCKKVRVTDPTWRFSEAFLLAYQGKMEQAITTYKRGFKFEVNTITVVEIEEFVLWMVQEEPDKTQLHFCLGLINHLGKGDNRQALKDFNTFLKLTEGTNPQLRDIARKYIEEIKEAP